MGCARSSSVPPSWSTSSLFEEDFAPADLAASTSLAPVTVALVTDSTAYLSAPQCARLGVRVVPLHVVIGGQERSEGVDVTPSEVAAALRDYRPVSTSRPSPAAFLEAYESAARGGAHAVVSVHLSGELSSTVGGARLAAPEAPIDVVVVDSRALGMVMAYAVSSAAVLAAQGASVQTVARHVRSRCARSRVVFYVDTLEHLRRGGRIGKASALLGSALAIKPILTLRDGVIVPLEKVRTASRAIARLEDLAVTALESAPGDPAAVEMAVHHVDSQERALRLAERLAARLGPGREVPVVELGPAVAAHVGPGTLAVAVVPGADD